MTEISAAEAAARLGVKRETLYAYVSRGQLARERRRGSRGSVFDANEVEVLAARTRRGGRAGALEIVVASGITSLEGDRLHYRGRDAADLAGSSPFEAVADWLWTGDAAVLAKRPHWPPAEWSGAVALGELLEDPGLLVLVDPDAGVRDRDGDHRRGTREGCVVRAPPGGGPTTPCAQ